MAGVLVSGTNGIVVNLASAGNVVLSGLDFEGIGAGINGVNMIGLGKLTIVNCRIRNFTNFAVNVAGATGARVFIVNTLMTNNAGGVSVGGTGGVANFATLVNSVVDANTTFAVQTTNAAAKITLKNTELTGSPAAITTFAGSEVLSIGPSNFLTGTGTPTTNQAFQ